MFIARLSFSRRMINVSLSASKTTFQHEFLSYEKSIIFSRSLLTKRSVSLIRYSEINCFDISNLQNVVIIECFHFSIVYQELFHSDIMIFVRPKHSDIQKNNGEKKAKENEILQRDKFAKFSLEVAMMYEQLYLNRLY